MPTASDTLLRYRPWRGTLRGPARGTLALARVSLLLMFRRKLFWALYALAGLGFFFTAMSQYLVVWLQLQASAQTVPVLGMQLKVADLTKFLDKLNLSGSADTFGNFIWFQGHAVMIVLALAGAVLVGNDFHHGSLPFYLSKPIGRRHYLLGKGLGVAGLIGAMVTLPALVLFVESGLLHDWRAYYSSHLRELAGVLGYSLVLTVTLALLLLATSVWLRRTVPLVMVWTAVFVLGRTLANFLVAQQFAPEWRLLDLWNNLYLVGGWCLGIEHASIKPAPQPEVWQAAAAVAVVCAACLLYLRKRIQAVEIVS